MSIANGASSRIGHTIDNGRLEIIDLLGLGAYGAVYMARHIFTRKLFAVKCLMKRGQDNRQRQFQIREINLHSKVSSHPNVITLEKVIETPECIYVVLEYSHEGDLFYTITEKGGYVGNDRAIKHVFLQILDAVLYCHNYGIYHRDLKPENILVFSGGRTVKLADFGLATMETQSTDFGCGSTFYFSPECQGGLHSKVPCYATAPNDVWSLGVILINLTAGRNPWKQACTRDQTFSAYLNNPDFLKSILPISDELNDIIKRIFCVDPSRRMGLAELRARILTCRHFTRSQYDDHSSVSVPRRKGQQVSAGASYYYPYHLQDVHQAKSLQHSTPIPPQIMPPPPTHVVDHDDSRSSSFESSLSSASSTSTHNSASSCCSWYSMDSEMDFASPVIFDSSAVATVAKQPDHCQSNNHQSYKYHSAAPDTTLSSAAVVRSGTGASVGAGGYKCVDHDSGVSLSCLGCDEPLHL